MENEILISVLDNETRVALRENSEVVELYIEREQDRGYVGNIYLGKVVRVLPGMQAAFVDIGIDRAAFLYVSEVKEEYAGLDLLEDKKNKNNSENKAPKELSIQNMLKEGEEVLVQIAKDPIGTKGARITSHVSLPGRHLVYMPTMEHIGVSKRIEDEDERQRLKEIVQELRADSGGYIIRTVCEGKTKEEILADMKYLQNLWQDIFTKSKESKASKLIHQDLDLPLKAARDLTTEETKRIVIDTEFHKNRIEEFARRFIQSQDVKVEHYSGADTLFDAYGIDKEIEQALSRKVWLKSGGYIVIEQTEALVAIDVNTGKYVGKGNLEDTIVKTNLEAAQEIAYQLRLRNIGGIVIIDFIDMLKELNREKIEKSFEEMLKKDKAKTNISKISEFGIMQMTRKRTRANLSDVLTEPCYYCEGRGYLKSKRSTCIEILRLLRKKSKRNPTVKRFKVTAHWQVQDMLSNGRVNCDQIKERYGIEVDITSSQNYHLEQFEVIELS
ncbi:MAG: Rne/Rng family ribonuclease [Pseudomonadota bacterium]